MAEIVSKNPVTEAGQKTVSSRSHYSLGAPRLNTYRFGEYGCMDSVEVVPDDRNFQVALRHKLMTYTLGQPLLSKALIKKDCFYVPAQCILPLNWDKVYTNPLHGDDVDAGEVGCSVVGFTQKVSNVFAAVSSSFIELAESSNANTTKLEYILKYWLAGEMFFSNGCLLHQLGVKLSRLAHVTDHTNFSFDQGFDSQMASLVEYVKYFVVSEPSNEELLYVYMNKDDLNAAARSSRKCSFREFLAFARDGYSWSVTNVVLNSGKSSLPVPYTFYVDDRTATDVSLARVAAYQIVCAHYYSNDKIDYVYDANLYRQNVYDCILNYIDNNFVGDASILLNENFFTLNGSRYQYDHLSARYFNYLCTNYSNNADEANYLSNLLDFWYLCDYFRLLFGFNRSLRFADYFTNAKSAPLAVGDKNVAVGSNGVNVIDMVRGIQVNRFLNAVNRFGRRISEYTKGLFPGVHQSPDFHDPFFLGHTTDTIGQQQIENTGDGQRDQNSLTTILRSDAGQYAFETDFEKPGIFVSIIYFDIERVYSSGIDRAVQHVDRYDMFNPFMQFTGDQDIRVDEFMTDGVGTLGYGLNYLEYKTRVPQCSGGFVENLPGYAFLAEEGRHLDEDGSIHVSPSFIRSLPSEIDDLFTSLTGYSLGSYFHFIVVNNNSIEVDRPMVYAPSLL